MILVDHQIEELILFRDFTSHDQTELINPASIDVKIGKKGLLLVNESQALYEALYPTYQDKVGNSFIELPLSEYQFLKPKDCILVETEALYKFPDNVAGMVRLKSSRGREFYEHLEAGWIDPGYEGRLTLELVNHSMVPLPIYPGIPIAQLILFKTAGIPEKPYAGRYKFDNQVSISKGE